jgi:hypothetical protein
VQVLINTDHAVSDYEALNAQVQDVVSTALRHFSDHITRVEVHLGDENGAKSGPDDKRCMMEARFEGRKPLVVTHHAGTVESAVHGAAVALAKLLNRALGRTTRPRKETG